MSEPTVHSDCRTDPDFVAFLERSFGPFIDREALERLRSHGRVGYAMLHSAGVIDGERLADAIASFHELPRVSAKDMAGDSGLTEQLSLRFLQSACLFPYRANGNVTIAAADPTADEEIGALRIGLGCKAPVTVASFEEISACLDRLAGHANRDQSDVATAAAETAANEMDTDRLQDLATGAPIVQTVEKLLEAAVSTGGTDIHIEPEAGGTRVRVRIDGILRETDRLSERVGRGVISRIKILAGLNIAERRLPQDGRARLRIGSREADIRVATAPTLHGETLAMRLLVKEAYALDLSRLGMRKDDLARFTAQLAQPHGLIAVTGPTGSGKTTTLTAALSTLNAASRKIMTVEDPIEYQIPGISQTQTQPAIGLTFAGALRSFLRHDPDVLMVGEMRDSETASVAMQAALTGHLVLTTLHTNSACEAITRLIDLQVEPFVINAALRCIVGQRLVRRLCDHCKTPASHGPELAQSLLAEGRISAVDNLRFHGPVGCSRCAGTGFKGRIGIFEVLIVDADIRRMINDGAASQAIEAYAVQAGMTTMLRDGYRSAAAGLVDFGDVIRATA